MAENKKKAPVKKAPAKKKPVQAKKAPVKTEKSFLDKAKDLLNKADDILDESVDKVKKSKAYGSATEAFKKAEGYVDEKMDEFEKSGIKEKLGTMAGKAEKEAGGAFKKLKDFGKNLADKAEDKFEEMKGKPKSDQKSKKA
jgi:hypothetical protein